METIWVIASLHLITLATLAGVGYFCFKLNQRIDRFAGQFDSKQKLVPVDPDAVFFRSIKDA